MAQAVRRVMLSLALAALAAADAHGQQPEQAPMPARLAAPVAAPASGVVACPQPPTAGPVPGCGPPACAPYEDHNGPLLWGDPRLDQPCFAGPGWIASVEVGAVQPLFKAGPLTFPVTVGGDTHDVSPPLAELGWTASPRVEVGYGLPQGGGQILLGYRNVTSQGSANVPAFGAASTATVVGPHEAGTVGGGPGTLGGGLARAHSRMNLNVIDLYYASHESALGPNWDMRWDTGARLASFYYDDQAAEAGLQQRVSMNSLTGGAKGGLTLYRFVSAVPGLSVGGRAEGAYLMGHIRQSFAEVQTPAGGAAVGGASSLPFGQAVWVTALQASVRYTPSGPTGLGFEGGYLYEQWFSLGDGFANRGQLELQMLFLRLTYNY